jgi:hypothetical protein
MKLISFVSSGNASFGAIVNPPANDRVFDLKPAPRGVRDGNGPVKLQTMT